MTENPGEVIDHLTTGAVVTYVIQWLKNSGKFSWITVETKKLNRFISAILALAISLGISYSYNPEARDLTIHIPTMTVFMLAVWEWAKQFISQQLIYDGILDGPKK